MTKTWGGGGGESPSQTGSSQGLVCSGTGFLENSLADMVRGTLGKSRLPCWQAATRHLEIKCRERSLAMQQQPGSWFTILTPDSSRPSNWMSQKATQPYPANHPLLPQNTIHWYGSKCWCAAGITVAKAACMVVYYPDISFILVQLRTAHPHPVTAQSHHWVQFGHQLRDKPTSIFTFEPTQQRVLPLALEI